MIFNPFFTSHNNIARNVLVILHFLIATRNGAWGLWQQPVDWRRLTLDAVLDGVDARDWTTSDTTSRQKSCIQAWRHSGQAM
jgi:hypothetical protein